ncbi:MAG: response regulator [Wenzhouxiangella sp.]|jgi:two-component system chemotaxis response regulator CheY|nr:response regulator [Wenzhouxiangella sp.]
MKILIVDDSMFIRNYIERALNLAQITEVLTAKNGREAIVKFHHHKPELVTMDITMPEVDGIECTRRMVKLNSRVKILVVSAVADKATAITALKQGANGFLIKPFKEDELNEALATLIEGRNRGRK